MQSVSVSKYVAARITPGEKEALDALIERLAAADAAAGRSPDRTFANWLRTTIRTGAKDAGIPIVETTEAPAAKPASTKRKATRKAAR